MITGRVRGSVYSTIHHPFIQGQKLLVVERIDPSGKATGQYLIAVDAVGAGPGERVLIVDEGTGARQILNAPEAPVRSVIAGIIDDIDVHPATKN